MSNFLAIQACIAALIRKGQDGYERELGMTPVPSPSRVKGKCCLCSEELGRKQPLPLCGATWMVYWITVIFRGCSLMPCWMQLCIVSSKWRAVFCLELGGAGVLLRASWCPQSSCKFFTFRDGWWSRIRIFIDGRPVQNRVCVCLGKGDRLLLVDECNASQAFRLQMERDCENPNPTTCTSIRDPPNGAGWGGKVPKGLVSTNDIPTLPPTYPANRVRVWERNLGQRPTPVPITNNNGLFPNFHSFLQTLLALISFSPFPSACCLPHADPLPPPPLSTVHHPLTPQQGCVWLVATFECHRSLFRGIDCVSSHTTRKGIGCWEQRDFRWHFVRKRGFASERVCLLCVCVLYPTQKHLIEHLEMCTCGCFSGITNAIHTIIEHTVEAVRLSVNLTWQNRVFRWNLGTKPCLVRRQPEKKEVRKAGAAVLSLWFPPSRMQCSPKQFPSRTVPKQ